MIKNFSAYLKESLDDSKGVWIKKDKFETGDIVKDTRSPEFGKGIVKDASKGMYIIIEYENYTGHNEKDCEEGRAWSTDNHYSKYYRFLVHNKKRIENPELDPYGEEDWGYEDIKESKNQETRIMFKDLLMSSFGGDYDIMIDWLNDNWKRKHVYFIDRDNSVYKNSDSWWVVDYYSETKSHDCVNVSMTNGQCGHASGLIYLDEIELPKNKFKRIENLELDPYGEEDWGFEEIIDENYTIIQDEDPPEWISMRGLEKTISPGDRIEHWCFGYGTVLKNYKQRGVLKIRFDLDTVGYKEIRPDVVVPPMSIKIDNDKLKDRLKRIEDLKFKMKDIDPYGEEDWGFEEITENNSTEIKINMSVISHKYCDGDNNYHGREEEYENELKDLLLNKYVKFETFSVLDSDESNIIWITDKIIDLKHNKDNSVRVTISDGTKYNLLYSENSIYLVDQESVEKERLRKERLYQLYKELDPYGEEDWGE